MSSSRSPRIVPPGTAPAYDVVGDRYHFLATSSHTGGRYALWHAEVLPGGGPPPHIHAREDEGFYILEGTLTLHADGQRLQAGPGTFVNIPDGCVHGFRNETDRPVRLLILAAPGGLEGLFERIGVAVTDPAAPVAPVDATAIALIQEHAPAFGVTLVPPPEPGDGPHV
jgi:quercetin dioxygenase-like cupin family protein